MTTRRQRAAEEAAAWLEYSEANFQRVQAWVRQYWIWEVALSPVVAGLDGTRRRTLCFTQISKDLYPPELGPDPCPQVPPRCWHDLGASAHLRLRIRARCKDVERRYFEPVPASCQRGHPDGHLRAGQSLRPGAGPLRTAHGPAPTHPALGGGTGRFRMNSGVRHEP